MALTDDELQRHIRAAIHHQRLVLIGHLLLWGGLGWAYRLAVMLQTTMAAPALPLLPVLGGLSLLLYAHLRGGD